MGFRIDRTMSLESSSQADICWSADLPSQWRIPLHDSLNFRSSIFTFYFVIKSTHTEILRRRNWRRKIYLETFVHGGWGRVARRKDTGPLSGEVSKERRGRSEYVATAQGISFQEPQEQRPRLSSSRTKTSLVRWITIRRFSCRRGMWLLP